MRKFAKRKTMDRRFKAAEAKMLALYQSAFPVASAKPEAVAPAPHKQSKRQTEPMEKVGSSTEPPTTCNSSPDMCPGENSKNEVLV